MDYGEFAPDWDAVDLPQRAARDSCLQELALLCITNDPMYPYIATALADELAANDEVRAMLSSACNIICNMAIWVHGGRDEATDAFRTTLGQLREIARKGQES